MFLTIANTFAPRFAPKFGVPAIKPMPGETFDANNDLTLSSCGKIVFHRDGHVTRGSVYSVTHDALIEYNRRHMTRAAFNDCYDEGDESEMLLGDNG